MSLFFIASNYLFISMVIYNIYSRSSMCVLFPKYFMFARKFHPSHRIPSFFKNYLGNGGFLRTAVRNDRLTLVYITDGLTIFYTKPSCRYGKAWCFYGVLWCFYGVLGNFTAHISNYSYPCTKERRAHGENVPASPKTIKRKNRKNRKNRKIGNFRHHGIEQYPHMGVTFPKRHALHGNSRRQRMGVKTLS